MNLQIFLFQSFSPSFLVTLLESSFLSVAYLTVTNLARLGISVHCQAPVFRLLSPCARLQVLTKSTHLSKDCYLKLVLNPHSSEIRSSKQLDSRCIPTRLFFHGTILRTLFVILDWEIVWLKFLREKSNFTKISQVVEID